MEFHLCCMKIVVKLKSPKQGNNIIHKSTFKLCYLGMDNLLKSDIIDKLIDRNYEKKVNFHIQNYQFDNFQIGSGSFD